MRYPARARAPPPPALAPAAPRSCATKNLRPAGGHLAGVHQALQAEAVAHQGAHVVLPQQGVHKGGQLRGGGARLWGERVYWVRWRARRRSAHVGLQARARARAS